jgi:hypothetical protein
MMEIGVVSEMPCGSCLGSFLVVRCIVTPVERMDADLCSTTRTLLPEFNKWGDPTTDPRPKTDMVTCRGVNNERMN